MRILLCSPYLPKHTGGGEKYLFDCARILQEEGHEVIIAISQLEPLSKQKIVNIRQKYERFLNYSLAKIKFIASPLFTQTGFIKKLLWTAQFDVLYYQTDGSLFFSLAKKNILHIQVPLQLNKSSLIEKLKLANWSVKNTNSEFTKRYIEKFWQTKIDFVHQPYVDPQEFVTKQQNEKKEKIILSVGRFFCQLHSKRQDVLIDLFKQLIASDPQALKGWRLVLIGKNEDEAFAKQVSSLVGKAPISIIHDLDRQALLKFYRQASIYWHVAGINIDEDREPAKVEHFGISTLEAMAAKEVPVVINKGGQKEILGEKLQACLWDTPVACLNLTLKLIKDPKERARLATLAQERSLDFSKEKFTKILLAMLKAQ